MPNLVLSRKVQQSFYIGESKVTVVKVSGERVKFAVEADAAVKVLRSELKDRAA